MAPWLCLCAAPKFISAASSAALFSASSTRQPSAEALARALSAQ
jgi:hypothetical protein